MLKSNQIDIRLIGSGSTATNFYAFHPRTDELVSMLSRQTLGGIWKYMTGARQQSLLSRRGPLLQWSTDRRPSCHRSRRPVARPVEECEGVVGRTTVFPSASKAPKCQVHTCGLEREEEWAHLARIRWMKWPYVVSSSCSAVKRPDCSMRARSVHLLLPSTSSSASSSTVIPGAILKDNLKQFIICICEHCSKIYHCRGLSTNNLSLYLLLQQDITFLL